MVHEITYQSKNLKTLSEAYIIISSNILYNNVIKHYMINNNNVQTVRKFSIFYRVNFRIIEHQPMSDSNGLHKRVSNRRNMKKVKVYDKKILHRNLIEKLGTGKKT